MGSTRVLTNATGQVVDTYTYDAYGRLLSSTGTSSNSYQFAGEQRDSETGLDYLRARYYDADLGRFISKDSFAGFMDDPMSQHNYLYANANPVNFIDPTGHEITMADIGAAFSIIGSLAAAVGVGAGAGYLTGSALNGASGEDLLNLTDQWVAGFANTVSFGASTQIRRSLYGEIAEQNHSGFMWNMGQVAGTGVAMILGAATPENLTFSMGRSNWIATTYDAIGTGVGAWNTGTHIREGRLEWSDAFNLLPFVSFAFKGTKQFFGAAMDANGTLRSWGKMQVTSYLQNSYKTGWTSEIGAVNWSGYDIEGMSINIPELSGRPLSYELKHLNKHLPDTPQSAKQIRKDGSAHVFNNKETLSQVEAEILKRGQYTGTVRDAERYGLKFDEPIGYRIGKDGNKTPLHYGELKVDPDGQYHVIPRTGASK